MAALPIPRAVPRVTDERRWDHECGGKDPYPSEAAAQAALDYQKRHNEVRRSFYLQTYPCSQCNEWHIGNRR